MRRRVNYESVLSQDDRDSRTQGNTRWRTFRTMDKDWISGEAERLKKPTKKLARIRLNDEAEGQSVDSLICGYESRMQMGVIHWARLRDRHWTSVQKIDGDDWWRWYCRFQTMGNKTSIVNDAKLKNFDGEPDAKAWGTMGRSWAIQRWLRWLHHMRVWYSYSQGTLMLMPFTLRNVKMYQFGLNNVFVWSNVPILFLYCVVNVQMNASMHIDLFMCIMIHSSGTPDSGLEISKWICWRRFMSNVVKVPPMS
jgi:hypothetical protein